MFRPFHSKSIYQFCCTGKKKRKETEEVEGRHRHTDTVSSTCLLLANFFWKTVEVELSILFLRFLCTFYFLEHGKYCLYTISLVLIMQNTL